MKNGLKWTDADWEEWRERAAIMEMEAGVPRFLAEKLARVDVNRRKAERAEKQRKLFMGE
jgi:hypothetical protein